MLPRLLLFACITTGLACAAVDRPALWAEADRRAVMGRADLVYDQPVARSEEGLPVGNGRMGSLVWATPSALRFQINRVDVYANNSASRSFYERNGDYCAGVGFVDIDLGGAGGDVFPADACRQRLSVYEGQVAVESRDLSARVIAWPARDVMAISLDDRRAAPEPIQVGLRMLRYASSSHGADHEKLATERASVIRTRQHTATSRLLIRDGRIVLTQEFREGNYLNRSAVAIALAGRPASAWFANESEVRLAAPAARGPATVLVASAASFDPDEDVVATALRELAAAERKGFDGLSRETAAWWQEFWARGGVQLHSADGEADYVAANYHYFLYLMAATSRGAFPPKFNGMLWNTAGDLRIWGVQHWFANLSCYYEALPAANRLELMEPVYAMYGGMREACARAAREQWGSAGIFIPETTFFDGLAPLPAAIAAEMRELYLLRKPWEERSAAFMEFAATQHPHSSRWNWFGSGEWRDGRWVPVERGSGPYGPVTHILGTTAKIPYLFWRHYEYTLDREFLRTRAYPMIRDAAEFYRNFPNLQKGADGRYHLHHANSNESVWGARDTDEDLSAMRGILSAALRSAEILDVDPDQRRAWREVLDHLAPLPVSDDADALSAAEEAGPRTWVRGRRPAVAARGARPDPNSLPQWFFDLCNLESTDAEAQAVANATFDGYFPGNITADTPVGVLSKLPMAAATLGRAEAVRYLIPNQMRTLRREREAAYGGGRPLANRLSLREGHEALDAQRLGRAAEALHLALLQSNPPEPAGEAVIRVFPAWPRDWEASYTLRARGAFLVSSAWRAGEVDFVELQSEAGAPCRLRNPWGEARVRLTRDGRAAEELAGGLLAFSTRAGERIVVTRAER